MIKEEINLEFESIKNNVIYFDWNIMNYMLYSNNITNENLSAEVNCLSHIFVNNINHKHTVFPYSNAHLLDIRMGDPLKENEKINLLIGLSKNWQITEEPTDKEKVRLNKILDIKNDYLEYCKHLDHTEKVSNLLRPTINKIIEPQIIEARKKIDESNDINFKIDIETLFDSLLPGSNNKPQIEILKFNKKLRNQKLIMKGRKFKFPNAVQKIEDLNPDTIKDYINSVLAKSDMPYNNYKDFFKTVIKIPLFSSFQQKISELCGLSDMIGLTSESTKKETSFQGIVNDQYHMLYGLRSHVFVSEDKNLLIKSRLIQKWMNLPVKIYNIDQFIEGLLKMIIISSDKDNTTEEFEYIFKDE